RQGCPNFPGGAWIPGTACSLVACFCSCCEPPENPGIRTRLRLRCPIGSRGLAARSAATEWCLDERSTGYCNKTAAHCRQGKYPKRIRRQHAIRDGKSVLVLPP